MRQTFIAACSALAEHIICPRLNAERRALGSSTQVEAGSSDWSGETVHIPDEVWESLREIRYNMPHHTTYYSGKTDDILVPNARDRGLKRKREN